MQVFADKFDAVIVLNLPVGIFELRFVLNSHTAFSHKPRDIAVLIAHPLRHIPDNFRLNFSRDTLSSRLVLRTL